MIKDELATPAESRNVYFTITVLIQAALVIGLILFLRRRDWEK